MSITGPGAYERATPVFDRTSRTFHPFTSVLAVRPSDRQVEVDVATRDGLPVTVVVSFPEAGTARLRWTFGAVAPGRTTEMLVGEPATLPLVVDVTEDLVTVAAGGTPVVIERSPWRVRFGGFATEPHDTSLVEWVAEPSGYAIEGDAVRAYETFALHPGEELYGLGERFHGPGLRGRRLSHWIDEPFGTNTTDLVYKSVPLVVSSRGYGLFFHHPEEAVFDLGAGSSASASVLVHAAELDLFLLEGPPKDVLRRYTALTGRAPVPPDWSFGVWLSRCMYGSRAEVESVVEEARSNGVPCDVVSVDPLWLANRPGEAFDSCDFVWNERDFGDLGSFVSWLHEHDVRLCLWVNTHVKAGSDAWRPERVVDGGRARDPLFPERGWVELTGAGADWWLDEMKALVAAGVDAFKLDYGETLPPGLVLADGRRSEDVHNLYPLLAAEVAARAGVAVHFTRAGTAGSQRHPLHWAGDSQATWAGLRGALRGGLSAAWSGFAHWTSDIGGFYRRDLTVPVTPDDFGFRQVDLELYVRWMQLGMLCSHTRFHGMSPREPWAFGDAAVAVAVAFGALRERLRPYLLRCAAEAADSGCPILRPMALEHPDDPTCRHLDTQYHLGPDLIVCPVLEPGGRVEAYVPAGSWTDHFTGERYEGPRWIVLAGVPLDRLPLLVRDGATPFT